MKKIVSILLLLAMLVMIGAGCNLTNKTTGSSASSTTASNQTTATTATTAAGKYPLLNMDGMFPVTKEASELKFCIRYDPTVNGEWEDLWWWNYMQKQTNVTIVPKLIASDVFKEQKTIMITSNDLPDVFFVNAWSRAETYEYGLQDGVFIKLTDYLKDKALTPNINAAFDRDASAKAGSTLPDGNIYGLPTIMSEYYVTASGIRAHWLNEWLTDAGIDWKTIKTLDDFYKALEACRDGDHNKNGKADEIPWTYYWGTDGTAGMAFVVSYILNAMGIITNDGLVAVNYNTGKAGYAPMMDEYKNALVFLNKLYKEKLLDNDLFAQTETDMTAKYAKALVAFSTYWNPGAACTPEQWTAHEKGSNYDNSVITSQTPLIATAGKTPMTWSSGKISPNVFTITKACKIPEVAIRWADACYDPVISTYYRLGPEYGTALDTEKIGWGYDTAKTSPDGWDQAREDHKATDITGWQWIQLHVASAASVGYFGMDECLGLFKLHPDYLSAAARQWTYPYETYIMPYEVSGYPIIYYTEEENKTIELYKAALDEYVIRMTAKFIAGEESLEKWSSFQDQIKAMNGADYDKVLSSTYEAYNKNK